jgi:hypothetical protein
MCAFLRGAATLVLAAAMWLVIVDQSAEPDDDLRIQVPPQVAPGMDFVPMRAQVYTHLRDAEGGPRFANTPVEVRLERASDAAVLSRTRLQPSRGGSDLEGRLAVPRALPNAPLKIVAGVTESGVLLQITTPLRIGSDADRSAVTRAAARPVRALQRFSAGAITVAAGEREPAPGALAVQVRGGACVPELPCHVLVYVGEPAASVRIRANSTLSIANAAERAPTAGVLAFEVQTHGPEAELWLEAVRAGRLVARRVVRLPVALAALHTELNDLIFVQASAPRLVALAADGGCIVDAFRDGHWIDTGSIATCARPSPLPFALPWGLSRLQVRSDPLSADTAGVVLAYLRRSDQSLAEVTAELASAATRAAPEDAFAAACRSRPDDCTTPASLGYLAAILETEPGLWPLADPVTAYADSVRRLREARALRRTFALCALGVAGLALGLSIGGSALVAGGRVSQLFAGDPRRARRVRLRSYALAVTSAAALLLVCLALALYVLARSGR